jgi:FkbM family methyltransferase
MTELLVHRIGRVVTRCILAPGVRDLGLARAVYERLYVMGKLLSETRERRFLGERIEAGMVVLDIGANLGYYSRYFADLVGPTGRVYAFEPDPLSFQMLERRAARARYRNLEVSPAALGDRQGRSVLRCSRVNRADNRLHASHGEVPHESVEVPVTTLDAFCAARGIRRVDAIKMDVQGWEVAALAGMRETLARARPRWIFLEFSPEHLLGAGSSPESFWQALETAGYEPHVLNGEGRPSPVEDRAAFSRAYATGYTDIWACDRGFESRLDET